MKVLTILGGIAFILIGVLILLVGKDAAISTSFLSIIIGGVVIYYGLKSNRK